MTQIELLMRDPDFESVKAGETIFTQGDTGDVMYGVRKGEIEVSVDDRVLEVVGPGGIVGEMALIGDHIRSASARAKTDCEIVPITEKRFTFLVQETPFFALQVMRILSDRLRRQTQA